MDQEPGRTLNVKSRLALRRVDAQLHSRLLPEGLLTSLFGTKAKLTMSRPNTANTQPFLQPKDESFMNAQKRAGISRWLVYESEELQRRNGSGSGRMGRGAIGSFPGLHHGRK